MNEQTQHKDYWMVTIGAFHSSTVCSYSTSVIDRHPMQMVREQQDTGRFSSVHLVMARPITKEEYERFKT